MLDAPMPLPIRDWDDVFVEVRARLRLAVIESPSGSSPSSQPPSLERVKIVVLECVGPLDRLHVALAYERTRSDELKRDIADEARTGPTNPTRRYGERATSMPLGLAGQAMARDTPHRGRYRRTDEQPEASAQPLPRQEQCFSVVSFGNASARKRSLAQRLRAAVWGAVRAVLLGLVALLIFIEEWGWGPLSALVGRLARWPPIAVMESHIRLAPPRVALALFMLPALLLVPVKVAALYLIQDGRVTLGVAIIVAAKLVGTALVGRLFVLVETQLMGFAWVASCVGWWRLTRGRVMAALRESVLWHNGRALRRLWRSWLRRVAAPMH